MPSGLLKAGKHSRVKLAVVLACLGWMGMVRAGWGAEAPQPAGAYTIDVWQVDQGLPQISVSSIAQTPDGYLWLGTFNGLARFDGVRFVVFNDQNTPALGSRRIVQLDVDAQGALWILTEEGTLARMVAGQFQRYGEGDGLPASGAERLVRDSSRRLVLVDRALGLCRIEDGQLRPLQAGDPLQGGKETLLFGSRGELWRGREGKASRSDWLAVPVVLGTGEAATQTNLIVNAGALAPAGGYWLASTTHLYRVTAGQVVQAPVPLPAGVPHTSPILEDSRGEVWIAIWNKGVIHLKPDGVWEWLTRRDGLEYTSLFGLFGDREGNVWIGTVRAGLVRLRPRVFTMQDRSRGLPGDAVMALAQDRQDRIWIGLNGGGLACWQAGRLERVTDPAVLARYDLVYSLLVDRQDELWVGLYGDTLLRLAEGGLSIHNLSLANYRMSPRTLFEDHRGALWIGCPDGLLCREGGQLSRYGRETGLSAVRINALAEDRAGRLYIGTSGGGLNCLAAGRFTAYTQKDGLADDDLAALYVDREDAVWIGTANGGLCRFKGGRFSTVTSKEGLPSNTIANILEDDQGGLWLGSNRGLVRVLRQALDEFWAGRRETIPWTIYDRSDGLNTVDCANAGQGGCLKARDGKLWFATTKGVAVVDPAHLPFNSLPPSMVIEEVSGEDEAGRAVRYGAVAALAGATNAHPLSASLTLPPRTHSIEVRFTGLSLVAPEKVRFRYRLEPLETDWTDCGTRRTAYYAGMPSGRYQFRVTACNNDGVWNTQGACLGLHLLPPWWETWWFRGFTLAGLLGLVAGGFQMRLRTIRRERIAQERFSRQLIASQEQERQRIAGELHDELGQELLVITNQAWLASSRERNPAGTDTRLREISETAKQALQQVRNLAHNLRPFALDELGFTKAARAMVEKAGHSAGLKLSLDLAEVDGLLPPEFEINLFRILQEILNNVLKHAQASKVAVTLARTATGLRLVAEDNGLGFEPGPLEKTGLGLRQIAERAKMMGGHAVFSSRPGQGTRVTVDVPLGADPTG